MQKEKKRGDFLGFCLQADISQGDIFNAVLSPSGHFYLWLLISHTSEAVLFPEFQISRVSCISLDNVFFFLCKNIYIFLMSSQKHTMWVLIRSAT